MNPVHPRWRGEHQVKVRVARPHTGSSPLARGTQGCRVHDHLLRRFIPAGAGNTSKETRLRKLKAVHPRWRGEHL